MSSSPKRFLRSNEELRELVPNMGYCIATDHILVDGMRVGWMFREEPASSLDSGWRFFSGLETDAYLEDPENIDMYAVNTVANYDPEIVPFVDAPIGSAFERDDAAGALRAVVAPEENDQFPPAAVAEGLNPRYPAVEGPQPLMDGWTLRLPRLFSRRTDGESLVFWRPGVTVWASVSRIEYRASPDQRLGVMKKIVPADAFAVEEVRGSRLARLGYRLSEVHRTEEGERWVHAFYAFAFTDGGYADVTIYFDDEPDAATAHAVWLSLDYADPV